MPLDHGFRAPGVGDVPADHSRTIEIFAREVVAADKRDDAALASMPWLVFMQGGPGFECARLTETGGWIARAVASHRVLLLDQRGTGRSSRVSTSALAKLDGGVDASAAHLALFRADSIVADAECVRKTLLGPGDDAKWALLGQSFGGFCIARYLSVAAESVSEAFLTGGLPPLVHEANAAETTYRALIERVRTQNAKFYRRFPGDVKRVRDVASFVRDQPGGRVATPSGGWLTTRGIQALGFSWLGTAGGMESLHYLFEKAWEVPHEELSYAFLKSCEDVHAFDTNRCTRAFTSRSTATGGPSAWAAERVFDEHRETFSVDGALRVVGPAQAGAVHRRDGVSVYVRRHRRVEAVQRCGRRVGGEDRLAGAVRRRRSRAVRRSRGVRQLRRGHVRRFRTRRGDGVEDQAERRQGLVHERVHALGREGGRRADTDEADGDGARRGAAAVRAVRGGVSAG